MGGAYLTTRKGIAKVAAGNAAFAHSSEPVVLIINPVYPLYPDEDWVVEAVERPHDDDFDWDTDEWTNLRYKEFFDDLFRDYLGDGHSLSDEYVRRYTELNQRHNITADDSLKYIGNVRQNVPISPDQIATTM